MHEREGSMPLSTPSAASHGEKLPTSTAELREKIQRRRWAAFHHERLHSVWNGGFGGDGDLRSRTIFELVG